jgi:hypothetical protein
LTEENKMTNPEFVRFLLSHGGPLWKYLHPDADQQGVSITFGRLKEIIEQKSGVALSYSDFYDYDFAGWLFNAELYVEAEADGILSYGNLGDE